MFTVIDVFIFLFSIYWTILTEFHCASHTGLPLENNCIIAVKSEFFLHMSGLMFLSHPSVFKKFDFFFCLTVVSLYASTYLQKNIVQNQKKPTGYEM